jgi:hypothetical protein
VLIYITTAWWAKSNKESPGLSRDPDKFQLPGRNETSKIDHEHPIFFIGVVNEALTGVAVDVALRNRIEGLLLAIGVWALHFLAILKNIWVGRQLALLGKSLQLL